MRIKKVETGTNIPLSGAVFEIRDPEGKLIYSMATPSSGIIDIPLAVMGNYTVTETTPPHYHLLPENRTQSVTVRYGEVAEVTFTNASYGAMRVSKYDAANGRPLSGAAIQIRNIVTNTTQKGRTDSSGNVVFDKLPVGAYEILELASPDGYALDSSVHTVNVVPLGRNYVQAGYCTEEFFIERGIRFIAINDSIDTMQENNDIAAFHHVLNEFYPKQVSKKVRQVKQAGAKQGKFMNSQAPYGYTKSPQDKHILIVDEEAARIVCRLFSEYADGDSARMIADRLNREMIDSPRFYHYTKMGRDNPLPKQKNAWGSATVMQMLRSQVYIGNMVQGKREVISFKTKKRRVVAPEDWVIVENTHEPLIAPELWDKVQARLSASYRVRKTKEQTVGMFAGILKCADCDSTLAYMRKKLKSGEKGVYRCSRYANNGSQSCTTHTIDVEVLESMILHDIQHHAKTAIRDESRLFDRLMAFSTETCKNENAARERALRDANSRISFIENAGKKLFEEKVIGNVPDSLFKKMLAGYEREIAELDEKAAELRRQIQEDRNSQADIQHWINLMKECATIDRLDRATAYQLIDYVTVHEQCDECGIRTQSVDIKYNFVGCVSSTETPQPK